MTSTMKNMVIRNGRKMNGIIDFSNCKINDISDYGGSDRKFGIYYNDTPYMIKFAEKTEKKNELATSSINNCISEYIGSRIAKSVGIPAHDTLLGYYNGELVVACKDFCDINHVSHEFSYYMRKNYDSKEIGKTPKLEQIYNVIENDPAFYNIKDDAIKRYWDTFVIDALTANFDRHKGNWSYLVDKNSGKTSLAPTYDYGSTMYPSISDEGIDDIIHDSKKICERIFVFPNAALLINNKKTSYNDMLSSNYNTDCNKSVLDIVPRISREKINNIIDSTPLISEKRKAFYKIMAECREILLLKPAYNNIINQNYNLEAYDRLYRGIPYSKEQFNKDWNEGRYNQTSRYINLIVDKHNDSITIQTIHENTQLNNNGRLSLSPKELSENFSTISKKNNDNISIEDSNPTK